MSQSKSSPESAALLAIFRAADRLRRYLNDRLAPHGLTLQQYNVLRILRGADGELPTMEIGDRMMERSPGVTRIVDTLVGKGYVERRLPAEDRRRVLCRLTPDGIETLAGLDPAMDTADLTAFKALSAARLERLSKDLQAVADAVTQT